MRFFFSIHSKVLLELEFLRNSTFFANTFPMCKIPPLANASGILHIGGGLHPQMRRHPTFVGLRHIYRFAKLLHLQTSFAFRNFANPPPLPASVKKRYKQDFRTKTIKNDF
jgi:hypothetical protein